MIRDCSLPQQAQYSCTFTGNIAKQRVGILCVHTPVGKGSTSAPPGECLVILLPIYTPWAHCSAEDAVAAAVVPAAADDASTFHKQYGIGVVCNFKEYCFIYFSYLNIFLFYIFQVFQESNRVILLQIDYSFRNCYG